MQTYISILRGINVSGKNLIKMDALRQLYMNLGFENVESYIQSGNVMFRSDIQNTKELNQLISSKIKEVFDFEVPVMVFTIDEFMRAIQQNPFTFNNSKSSEFFHLTFLSENPENTLITKIDTEKYLSDEFKIIGKIVYLYCPESYGKTKLSNSFFEKKLKVNATTRNWKTINELLNIATKISE